MARLEIIRKRERVTVESHALVFDSVTLPGSGYSFPCDAIGNVTGDGYGTVAEREARIAEIAASGKYHARAVEQRSHSYIEHAVGRCGCGCDVTLSDALDNECECGRWYNMVGQEVTNPNSELGRELRAEDDRFSDEG